MALKHLRIKFLEIIGASIMVLGFIIASIRCIRESGQIGVHPAVSEYRKALGRTVLIGLEVLVCATIIKTVTIEPNIKSLGLLIMMIAIRTMLGWTTVLEMEGPIVLC